MVARNAADAGFPTASQVFKRPNPEFVTAFKDLN
jgi:hypothetical protein